MIFETLSTMWLFLYEGFLADFLYTLNQPFGDWLNFLLSDYLPIDIPFLNLLNRFNVMGFLFGAGIGVLIVVHLVKLIVNAIRG